MTNRKFDSPVAEYDSPSVNAIPLEVTNYLSDPLALFTQPHVSGTTGGNQLGES